MFKKIIILLLLLVSFASFTVQQSDIEGLRVEFKAITEDTIVAAAQSINTIDGDNTITAQAGMKFIRLRIGFKNEGSETCMFDVSNTYISTGKDSLYQFTAQESRQMEVVFLKPQKSIQRTLIYQFPKNENPKELFIEDKRYKIILKQK